MIKSKRSNKIIMQFWQCLSVYANVRIAIDFILMRFAKTCFISEGSYNAVRSSPIIEYILQILGRYNQFYVSSLHIIVVVFIVLKFSKFSKHFLSTSTPISLSSIIGQKCWFFPYQFKNFARLYLNT